MRAHQQSAGAQKKLARTSDRALRGGLSTKIHALVDALGNPIDFFLTGGEAHDLVGADHLLPTIEVDTLIADKASDAEARDLEPLAAAGKTAEIPPRSNQSPPRDYDRELYAARHLIENFFAKLASPHIKGGPLWQNAEPRRVIHLPRFCAKAVRTTCAICPDKSARARLIPAAIAESVAPEFDSVNETRSLASTRWLAVLTKRHRATRITVPSAWGSNVSSSAITCSAGRSGGAVLVTKTPDSRSCKSEVRARVAPTDRRSPH